MDVTTNKLIALTNGAIVELHAILQTPGWTKLPREKHTAGRLAGQLEEQVVCAPDPCVLPPQDPAFRSANLQAAKKLREWRGQKTELQITSIQLQTVKACVKHLGNSAESVPNPSFAELQELFEVTE